MAEIRQKGKSITAILEMLSKLSDSQKRQILDFLALSLQNNKNIKLDRNILLWATAIVGAWEVIYPKASITEHTLLGMSIKKSFCESHEKIDEFLIASGLTKLKVTERTLLYKLLAKLLVNQAYSVSNNCGIPMSLNLVFNQKQSIVQIFDIAFPGYLRSGLVKTLLYSLMNKTKE